MSRTLRYLGSAVSDYSSGRLVAGRSGSKVSHRTYTATAMATSHYETSRGREVSEFVDDEDPELSEYFNPGGSSSYPSRSGARRDHDRRTSNFRTPRLRFGMKTTREEVDERLKPFEEPDKQYEYYNKPLIHARRFHPANPETLKKFLQELLPPLSFPPRLATQMLTHISAMQQATVGGHNGRLSFVGRRVLESYLLLFVQHAATRMSVRSSSPESSERHSPSSATPNARRKSKTVSPFPDDGPSFSDIVYRALQTQFLGETVGTEWGLDKIMIWMPATTLKYTPIFPTPTSQDSSSSSISQKRTLPASTYPGFAKVAGTTVEGIMGGVYHQFGAKVAQRVFHTRVLPHLLRQGSPKGLHDAYHSAALDILYRMGGVYSRVDGKGVENDSGAASVEGSLDLGAKGEPAAAS